jgi:hypothetical protein
MLIGVVTSSNSDMHNETSTLICAVTKRSELSTVPLVRLMPPLAD